MVEKSKAVTAMTPMATGWKEQQQQTTTSSYNPTTSNVNYTTKAKILRKGMITWKIVEDTNMISESHHC